MSAAGWFIVLLALLLANLPFVNQRLLALVPIGYGTDGAAHGMRPDGRQASRKARRKNGWIRIGEMIVLYFVVGVFGRMLEARAGNVFEQGWQFYAVTFSLYLVFAFPGFTFQYLLHRRG